jgi:hypothetical protein
LLAYRELDDTLGLTDRGADELADARTGKNGHHRLGGLPRQSVLRGLADYEDVSDAKRLCRDRRSAGWSATGRLPALRFGQPNTILLDVDSSESPTYGEQEGSVYNGHFG